MVVFGFTLALSLVCGVGFGLAPALRTSAPCGSELAVAGRSSLSGRAVRLHRSLVIAEVALAVVLVMAAGLLAKSLWALQRVDPGLVVEHLYSMQLAPSPSRYVEEAERAQFYDAVEERIAAIPGVVAVGAASGLPLTPDAMGTAISPDGLPVPEGTRPMMVGYRLVTPGYLSTAGVKLLAGRHLSAEDAADATDVGIINHALAERLWPGENAVGRELRWSTGDPWFEVVGVIGDMHQSSLGTDPTPEVFVPYAQEAWLTGMSLLVRAEQMDVLPALRSAVWDVDSTVPISRQGSMTDVVRSSLAAPRSYAVLFGGLAALALGLGAVGVFGVMSYLVVQRTHEIGVRLALGASRGAVVRHTIGSGMVPVAIGLVLGCAAALASGRLLSSLLFAVEPSDPLVVLGVVALLATVALAANLVPALRAARVDPIESLRSD